MNFKLINASFEESLNLQDDNLINYMIRDVEKPGVKEKPIVLKFLSIVFITLLYGMCVLVKYFIEHPDPSSPVPTPKINFLPLCLYWVFLVIFIIIWITTIVKRNKSTKFFFGYINTINYLFWLVIEVNLFFLTFLLSSLTLLGVLALACCLGLMSYIVFKSKLKSIEKQLFNIELKSDKVDDFIKKIFKFLIQYGWIVVIIVVLWKLIFPETNGIRTDVVGFFGIVAMWIVFDIGFIVVAAYLFLPYLLYGYYKYKYPEEYREWEGKTQLEWYGEKYFNKHIKGTEKEEKKNDGN